ncbi:MAG TPA: hypothetical protein VLV83_11450 [Acidobacteriota bacterium]|nr:hypothetical protein [Acidobacteriota bacterium]
MLYLHPPYYMYEGVPLVGDYHDPRQFYYFPNRPRLAVDEQGRPAIRFLVFRENLDEIEEGDEEAVGFLVFDTSLAWPEDTLNKVARRIQEDQDLDDPPRLSPLPYRDGTVRLTLLDRTTTPPSEEEEEEGGSPTPEEEEEEQRWVSFLEASAAPALYGENRAIFSAMLTKRATTLLFGAFEGFIPAGVVYDLGFVGMQRAFNVHVEVDWEQTYHFMQERWSIDLVFFQADIENIVEELEENQIIKFEASLEGVGEEAMEAEFNTARRELQEYMLERFFKPVANPNDPGIEPGGGTVDGVLDASRRIHNMAHHWPSVGYQRLELDVSEIRRLDIDYTVARAVERRIAPQAHMSLFFEDYNLTRDDVVTVVDGRDALFESVDFEVVANANFAGHSIRAIATDVFYGEEPEDEEDDLPLTWSFLLEDGEGKDRASRSAWYKPEVGDRLRYRYNVHFLPDAPVPGPQPAVGTDWLEHQGTLLVLSPHNLYRFREVEAQVIRGFPFERIPQVHLHMRYFDEEAGWSHEDSVLLDETSTRFAFKLRTRPGGPQEVDYRMTYLRPAGERIEKGWRSTTSDLVLIEDPAADELEVRVLVAGDRSKILNLIVDLRYEDPENEVQESGSILIDQDNVNQIHLWTVALENPNLRRYEYAQTLIDNEGNVMRTGWVQDDRRTLTVGVVYAFQMEVQPELVGPPLSDNRVEMIRLKLHYEDEENEVEQSEEMVFTSPGKGQVWRVNLQDASAREYTYELTYVLDTGFQRTVGPLASRDKFLILSSVPPED